MKDVSEWALLVGKETVFTLSTMRCKSHVIITMEHRSRSPNGV
jgi:hypothetical protein